MRNVNFLIKIGDQLQEKTGVFEEWGLMPIMNNVGDTIANESCAIVVENGTHKVYRVSPEDVTFVDPFHPTLANN